jgi:NADH:ubiquinone reductase (H+-translocating)
MKNGASSIPRIVIVGGGFAGVAVAQELERLLPSGSAEIHMISRENYFLFHPMLPEVAGGGIEPHHILNSLRQLCPRTTVSLGLVRHIDIATKSVEFVHGPHEDHAKMTYDYLVMAFGAVTNFSELSGMAQHALGLKTVADALYLRNHVVNMLEAAEVEPDEARRRELLTFVVVGGGFSGVETVAEMNDFIRHSALKHYRRIDPKEVRVVLLHGMARILPELTEDLAAIAHKRLEQIGVEVHLNAMLNACTQSEAILGEGEPISTRTLVCTIGAAPNPVLSSLEAAKDERGRVKVEPTLQVEGLADVWSLGDCTAVPNQATGGSLAPPTAQFAQREGKLVAHNVVAAMRGQAQQVFSYPGMGQFVSVGHQFAVANILGMKVSGFIGWWLWRSVYLFKLPGLSRKARVAIDWTLDLLFGRDIIHMQLQRVDRVGRAHYVAGDFILRQGDATDHFYVIVEGEVEVSRKHPDGTEIVLSHLGAGDHFGDMALLEGRERHSASVRALTAVNVLTLGRDDFKLLANKWEGLNATLDEVVKGTLEAPEIRRAAAEMQVESK